MAPNATSHAAKKDFNAAYSSLKTKIIQQELSGKPTDPKAKLMISEDHITEFA